MEEINEEKIVTILREMILSGEFDDLIKQEFADRHTESHTQMQ